MLVTLGRPGESLHQPSGHGQSFPFNGSVAVYIYRLPSLCVVWWETGRACTPNLWEEHAQLRFEIHMTTRVGRNFNVYLFVSDVQLLKNSTLTPYSREQQQNKVHLPRIESFLLKSVLLILCWAHKDGCWVRMNWECRCVSPGGSWTQGGSTSQLCGQAAAEGFLGNDLCL